MSVNGADERFTLGTVVGELRGMRREVADIKTDVAALDSKVEAIDKKIVAQDAVIVSNKERTRDWLARGIAIVGAIGSFGWLIGHALGTVR